MTRPLEIATITKTRSSTEDENGLFFSLILLLDLIRHFLQIKLINPFLFTIERWVPNTLKVQVVEVMRPLLLGNQQQKGCCSFYFFFPERWIIFVCAHVVFIRLTLQHTKRRVDNKTWHHKWTTFKQRQYKNISTHHKGTANCRLVVLGYSCRSPKQTHLTSWAWVFSAPPSRGVLWGSIITQRHSQRAEPSWLTQRERSATLPHRKPLLPLILLFQTQPEACDHRWWLGTEINSKLRGLVRGSFTTAPP